MEIISGGRSIGKTKKLLEYAKENGCTVVCKNKEQMAEKALGYGIVGLDFIEYQDFADFHNGIKEPTVIDDYDKFAEFIGNVKAVSVTIQ